MRIRTTNNRRRAREDKRLGWRFARLQRRGLTWGERGLSPAEIAAEITRALTP